MSTNRFSILALDEEEVDLKRPTPILAEPIKEVREWKLDDGKPSEVRKWNLDESKFERVYHKRPFHRGYAFKEDTRPPSSRSMHGYSFKDDSPPAQDTKKPTTPEPLDLEFPKLSEYQAPMTPPYGPCDIAIPTLAERIKHAMEEKHLSQREEINEGDTLEMYSVIPMKTNLSGSLKFTQD
jgi:hypothetical protein